MKLYNFYLNVSSAEAAEMEKRALTDDAYLRSLVSDGWHLSLPLQRRIFEMNSCRVLEAYIKRHQLAPETEVMLCDFGDDDLIKEYIRRYSTLLGATLLSQEFILKLFDLPSGKEYLEQCVREGVWFSPKVQVRMLKEEYGQDLLLRYLVPYSKYALWQDEKEKNEIPLCRSAQMSLLRLPNAREVIWFLSQTWKLCPRAEQAARRKGLI